MKIWQNSIEFFLCLFRSMSSRIDTFRRICLCCFFFSLFLFRWWSPDGKYVLRLYLFKSRSAFLLQVAMIIDIICSLHSRSLYIYFGLIHLQTFISHINCSVNHLVKSEQKKKYFKIYTYTYYLVCSSITYINKNIKMNGFHPIYEWHEKR